VGVGNPCYGRGSDMSRVTIKCVTKADPHFFQAFRHQFSIDFDERKCETDCNNYMNSPVQ
jgi:hypothetical protein